MPNGGMFLDTKGSPSRPACERLKRLPICAVQVRR